MKYTKENLQEEALKYNSRGEFQKYSYAKYKAAYNRKLLDKICSHMKSKYNNFTNEELQKEALKYNTRISFQRYSPKYYKCALYRGIMDDICKHIPKMNEEIAKSIAQKYETRLELQRTNNSAYNFLRNNKMLDIACKHMGSRKGIGRSTYNNRTTILYYIKIKGIHKIGITLHERYKDPISSILKQRYSQIYKNKEIKIIDYKIYKQGEYCYDIEKKILKDNSKFRYNGKKFILNENISGGETECFNENIYENISHYFK